MLLFVKCLNPFQIFTFLCIMTTPVSHFKAIQMIGTQRSGSNLLRLMLNQVPEIYAPHPPHILHLFYPLLAGYGDLKEDRNFESLIDDVCRYIELNPVPWENADLDRVKVAALCKRRTLLEVFIRINEMQCVANHKAIWCCKSLETVYYLDNFAKEDFRPFIIYLVRDGRDVALSFKKIMIGEKHIYHLAAKWKKEQDLALNYLDTLPAEAYIIVRYENLVADPASVMKEICAKLGVVYSDSVLNYYQSNESHKTAESGKMWENVEKPVMKDNTGKYKSEFSHFDLQLFERIAGDTMDRLAYKREISDMERVEMKPEHLEDFNQENERLKKLAVEEASQKDIQKRKPQKEFLEQLKLKLSKASS